MWVNQMVCFLCRHTRACHILMSWCFISYISTSLECHKLVVMLLDVTMLPVSTSHAMFLVQGWYYWFEGLSQLWSLGFKRGCEETVLNCEWIRMKIYITNLKRGNTYYFSIMNISIRNWVILVSNPTVEIVAILKVCLSFCILWLCCKRVTNN